MSYEVAIAVSTVMISFIFIYISTVFDKEKFPGFQFMFFSLGLGFIILSSYICLSIADINLNTDLTSLFTEVTVLIAMVFVLVIFFFMVKFFKHVMAGFFNKNTDMDED